MTVNRFRIQMMLHPEQHQALLQIARQQQHSLPELIRQAFEGQLSLQSPIGTLAGGCGQEAFAILQQHRHQQAAPDGDRTLEINPVALIQRMSNQRTAQISASVQADPSGWQRCCLDVTFGEQPW
jgi:hypothetical protein